MEYDDIWYGWRKERIEGVAEFRSTWPSGNEPDGETTVVIDVIHGVADSGEEGYILVCDDGNCGGSPREAGDTVYATLDDAVAAAKAYAAAHDEKRETETDRKPYQIGDGWLEVMMTAEEAAAWNDYTLSGEVLRSLLARRRDEEDYATLGEMLDSGRISRDDLADPASRTE